VIAMDEIQTLKSLRRDGAPAPTVDVTAATLQALRSARRPSGAQPGVLAAVAGIALAVAAVAGMLATNVWAAYRDPLTEWVQPLVMVMQ